MAKVRSRQLVIDADVARSAGESEHPISSACRAFLDTVRDVGHKLVMTEKIADEWRKHRSAYTRKWQTVMYARKLVVSIEGEEDDSLSVKIQNTSLTGNQKQAAEKDIHLIDAAIATDRLVTSKDENARAIFKIGSNEVNELKHIVWVNPTVGDEAPIEWLKQGAKLDRHRQLGAS